MKQFIILIALISLSIVSFAQVAINLTGNAPDGSAMLDIVSANKGILIPRMADHTSVGSPAKGVMVFDTSTNTFWFYNGSAWAELAAGGGGGCTLDQAYDFGGAGLGRVITASNGAVEFNNGANTAHFINAADVANLTDGTNSVSIVGTGTDVVNILSANKDYALSVLNTSLSGATTTIVCENTQSGASIDAVNSSTTNLYSAIYGSVNYGSTSVGNYPSGVAGYFDGLGMGVGVWGETSGNGTSSGAGVYGNATNNNFGVWGFSNTYPGVYAKTNSNSNPALQIASGSNSYTNPAIYSVGSVQFDCSNSGAQAVHINNVGGEPSITPTSPDYGYVGTSSYYWYRFYVDELYYKGAGTFKNNNNEDVCELIIKDIDKITPSFYQSSKTTTEIIEGQEYLYKPNLSLGVNIEELPDYLLDNSFSMISISGIATLSLAGVKYNRAEIQELKETVSDFGIVKMQSKEIWVSFDKKFSLKLKTDDMPTVTLTTNSPNAKVYISEQNSKGFKVAVDENLDNLMINWIAMAKVDVENTHDFEKEISPELYKQLRVPTDKKIEAKNLHKRPKKQKTMELIEPQNSYIKRTSKRLERGQ